MSVADAGVGFTGSGLASDQVVICGQNDEAAEILFDRQREIVGPIAHHDATGQHDRVPDGRTAGQVDAVTERSPDRHPRRDGVFHFPGHGQVLFGHRLVGDGMSDVDDGLHIVDHAPDIERNTTWRDLPIRHCVNEDIFITGRVDVGIDKKPETVRRGQLAELLENILVLFLHRDRH